MLIREAAIISGIDLLKKQDIKIDDNRIVAIGPGLKADRGEEILDGQRKLAIPGLVNAHTHLAMTLFRGYADDMELVPWLKEKIWPLEAKLNEEDISWGVKLGCLEQIRAGITCYCDMYLFPNEIASATKKMGLRAVVSAGFFDIMPDLLKGVEPFLSRWQGDELITPAIGPHAVNTCSKETLLFAKELAEKYKAFIHIHLSETRQEVADVRSKLGLSPVEYLESLGMLNSYLVAAHCVWVSFRDIKKMAARKANVVHCPVSNMKLASGFSPVERLSSSGVNVCLGTDGASSNNSLNIFHEMKVSAISEKCVRQNPTAIPAALAWKMATENAYSCFGLPMGLRAGCLADLSLIDLQKPWFYPENNIVSHLIYSMTGGVDTTIVNGKILMRDGIIPCEAEILEKAQERFNRLTS